MARKKGGKFLISKKKKSRRKREYIPTSVGGLREIGGINEEVIVSRLRCRKGILLHLSIMNRPLPESGRKKRGKGGERKKVASQE